MGTGVILLEALTAQPQNKRVLAERLGTRMAAAEQEQGTLWDAA